MAETKAEKAEREEAEEQLGAADKLASGALNEEGEPFSKDDLKAQEEALQAALDDQKETAEEQEKAYDERGGTGITTGESTDASGKAEEEKSVTTSKTTATKTPAKS